MYKIWQGDDPKLILGGLFFFIAVTSLVIHLFAFKAVGYPNSVSQKYPNYKPAATAQAVR